MDEAAIPPKITEAEASRRRRAVQQADAHNRIEGLQRGAETDPIFEAYVRGDIEVSDIVPRLKAQLGLT